MEIKITDFVKNYLLTGDASDFSCSQAERGSYAGKGSYQHAVDTTEEFSVVNEATRKAIEQYLKTFGAWDIEEIQAWTDAELNGVCLQLIAGDFKEWEMFRYDDDAFEYLSGNFISADDSVDGEWYYYFGE